MIARAISGSKKGMHETGMTEDLIYNRARFSSLIQHFIGFSEKEDKKYQPLDGREDSERLKSYWTA